MSFLAPLALLGLGLLPVVVLMYLLKLRRKPVVIPSTLLWRRAMQDMVANAPFQRLRNNLLLWLQLLIVALLALGLARPLVELAQRGETTTILLIDLSASMQTKEAEGKTRLDLAKERALQAVEDMQPNESMYVLGFSRDTRIVQPVTRDRALLRRSIESLTADDTPGSLREAALILDRLTKTSPSVNVVEARQDVRTLLISDGALGSEAERLAEIPNLTFFKVGQVIDNLGITAMDVRESFAETVEYQVFASVGNASPDETKVLVTLSVDESDVDVKELTVPARGVASVVFTLQGGQGGVARVRLPEGVDSFPLDDSAQATIAAARDTSILLVSSGNYFLEQAFAVVPKVRVSRMQPVDYSPAMAGQYDVVVFDNTTPPAIGAGNFLVINAVPNVLGYAETGEQPRPVVIDWNRTHPLMRFVNMDKVLIDRARVLTTPAGAVSLVEAEGTDLVSLLENETRRVVTIGFDIFKSYWPLEPSFPIFMANLVDYFKRQGQSAGSSAYATGSTINIIPPREAAFVTVTDPAGEKSEFRFSGNPIAYFTQTARAGLYRMAFDMGGERLVPVNLVSEEETFLAPVAELALSTGTLQAVLGSARTRQEIWPYLVLIALLVLAAEWAIYCWRTWL